MDQIDPKNLALTEPLKIVRVGTPHRRPPRHRNGEEFVKGPIPMAWLTQAAKLPGKALAVGMALWFKAGATRSQIVRVKQTLLDRFGVGRKAGYRCLQDLEKAGLIKVERHKGRKPVVTIEDVRDEPA